MQTSDRLIRQLAFHFKKIQEEFNLLRWIDEQITTNKMDVDEFMLNVTVNTRDCLGADKAGAFLINTRDCLGADKDSTCSINESLTPFDNKCLLTFDEGQQKKIIRLMRKRKPKINLKKNLKNNGVEVITDSDRDLAFLIIPIIPIESLRIALILQSAWYGGDTSSLQETDLHEVANMIGTQCEILIKTKIDQHLDSVRRKIVDAFFKAHLEPEECWLKLVDIFASFLPSWKSAKIDPLPLVQVLTYDGNGKSILLRATHAQKKSSAKNLLLAETICGIVIEDEENKNLVHELLYINPTEQDYKRRYASYLFKDIPGCELVMPIRTDGEKGGEPKKTIGLINLEHSVPWVFGDFHIWLLHRGIDYITPFVDALLGEEKALIKRNYSILYVLQKILVKMAKTYRHKVGQHIATSTLSLEALGMSLELNEKQREQFERLTDGVNGFAMQTKNFIQDLPDYIRFDKTEIISLVKQAINEFSPADLKDTEEIQFTFENEMDHDTEMVFASPLAREHIYNVLNNSVQAVRHRMEAKEISEGTIKVTISLEKQVDRLEKEDSFPVVIVSIQDNGGGIDPKNLDRIFDFKFSTKKATGGQGFGLYTAKEYMLTIGGNIYVMANDFGNGMSMAMSFPAYTPEIHNVMKEKLMLADKSN